MLIVVVVVIGGGRKKFQLHNGPLLIINGIIKVKVGLCNKMNGR